MEIIAITFDVFGTILIAFTALRVHHHVIKEHKIDAQVFREMRQEQVIGFTGIIFLLIGYIIQLISRLSL